jgi:hypothetical protein
MAYPFTSARAGKEKLIILLMMTTHHGRRRRFSQMKTIAGAIWPMHRFSSDAESLIHYLPRLQ